VNRKLTAVYLALLAFLVAGPAAADTVVLADGQPLIGELHAGSGPAELRLKQFGEPEITLKRADILAIDFGNPPADPLPIAVTLHTGDRLAGTVSLGPGARLTLKRQVGTLIVPLTAVASVRFKPQTPLPPPGASDVVVLANGDRLDGKLESVEASKLTFRSSLGQMTLDLKRVVGIVMARRDVTPGGEGLRVALDLAGGERMIGQWRSLSEEHVELEMGTIGTVRVPRDSVARLVVQNGRVVFLADLRPLEARHVPYLDTERPHRVNQSQGGRVLQLGGTKYSHGLGVHSRSELTYELGGKFKQFATTVGVDDEVGEAGSVIFRIWGDEKLLFESPVMLGGDIPKAVQADVTGVLLLRLEVDYADDGDLSDHADWANARLLR
jgi:hypothetical protein